LALLLSWLEVHVSMVISLAAVAAAVLMVVLTCACASAAVCHDRVLPQFVCGEARERAVASVCVLPLPPPLLLLPLILLPTSALSWMSLRAVCYSSRSPSLLLLLPRFLLPAALALIVVPLGLGDVWVVLSCLCASRCACAYVANM
jgi:hypothetical protein